MSKQASILIVDDESGPAESLRTIFKSRYDVVVASSAMTALEILRSLAIDVIIIDSSVPPSTDPELLASLRAADPEIEIVLVTAGASADEAPGAAAAHQVDSVRRPFDVTEVVSVVANSVARRQRGKRDASTDQLAEFACDLRNPLHAIFGYSEILADESENRLDHWQREALQRLQANALLLVGLLDSACRAKPVAGGALAAASWMDS